MALSSNDAKFAEIIARTTKLYEYMSNAQDKYINDAIKPALKAAADELLSLIDAYPDPTTDVAISKEVTPHTSPRDRHASSNTTTLSSRSRASDQISPSATPHSKPQPITYPTTTSQAWKANDVSTTTGDKQPHHPSEFAQDSKQNHDAQVQALLDEERTTRRPRPVHSQTNILARPPIKVERTGPQTHAAHTPNVTAPSPDWVHTSEVSISSRPSLDKDPTLSQLPWDHALSSVLPEIRMNGQGPSGQWFPLPPPPPPLAPPPALPINSCEVPRIDLKDACPCSLIGHSCPYPEECGLTSVCVYWLKNCRCQKPHVTGTCRDWREGRPCFHGSKCYYGHDAPGQDIRRRKMDAHAGHHQQMVELSKRRWQMQQGKRGWSVPDSGGAEGDGSGNGIEEIEAKEKGQGVKRGRYS